MKIICVGRNYQAHAKEMGSQVPDEPILFLKPDTALNKESKFYHPKFTQDLHYECELVVKINKMGKNIQEEFAHKYYDEISLGIDFTARDLQRKCKSKGLPWEISKAFDHSAIVSNHWIDKKSVNLDDLNFSLSVNDLVKQEGNTSDMLFKIDQLISNISTYFTLKTGDLIFTGTPEGVGPVKIGDILSGKIEDQEMFKVSIH